MLLRSPVAGVLLATAPSAQLGHVVTLCSVLHAVVLFTAFARLRATPALCSCFA
ncbi:hypothetical protein ACFT4A_30750 [Streptomyces sp. NPDC057099]|uniref:hypothetical protein n=1 Tax=Streptomyces sp. NPDC057099 TaxID=3346019 RepID=UPI00362D046D